jgi:hypothetical protein
MNRRPAYRVRVILAAGVTAAALWAFGWVLFTLTTRPAASARAPEHRETMPAHTRPHNTRTESEPKEHRTNKHRTKPEQHPTRTNT